MFNQVSSQYFRLFLYPINSFVVPFSQPKTQNKHPFEAAEPYLESSHDVIIVR